MTREARSPDPALVRAPVVAGRFYPGSAKALARDVAGYLAGADPELAGPALLCMVPHAGYVFSGAVAGRTLGAAALPDTLLLLGPNHTGLGARLAVWPGGAWEIPGATVPVAETLATELLEAAPRLTADRAAHLSEHSLEVVLPFLYARNPAVRIVPVAVAEPDPAVLAEVGRAVAAALRRGGQPVGIVVSSDMSHYVSHEAAKSRDALALSRVLALDPYGLCQVVRREGITMCGVLPMALGLFTALELGAREAFLAAYATSGEVTGDMEQVVGYAGVLVR